MIYQIKRIALIVAVFLGQQAASQQVYQFTQGLAAAIPGKYGREAIYTDRLSFLLYTGQLKQPGEGGVFGTDDKGQAIVWQALAADSSGRLIRKDRQPRNAARGPQGPWVIPGGGAAARGLMYYTYLTYTAATAQTAILNIKGNSAVYVNGVLHAGDVYSSGYLSLPVALKKGLNELYVRGSAINASLLFPAKPVLLATDDPTLPHVLAGRQQGLLKGAVVIINSSQKELKGLVLKSKLTDKATSMAVPAVPAMSIRKVPFTFDASGIGAKGTYECLLTLQEKDRVLDQGKVTVEAVTASEQYAATFTSDIDGSLQYYAVTPQTTNTAGGGDALFLSVHGAGVEAIGQARAYRPKAWGTLVAATNRRPRGFNWEDWGRLDALEVLALAKETFRPDPRRIYLTGHSMGGHGTWFLGATYPDQWAAIAPCAGYPTLKEYGSADGLVPDSSASAMERMLLRAGNQSDVPKLASNYTPLGIYVLHGSEDEVVSVNYARQMRKQLGTFHPDMSYYEYPGGGHWFGSESVDWKPLFDFFQWHSRLPDTAIHHIDFITSNPGISAAYSWATIYQQEHPLQYSRIRLNREPGKDCISGSTENVRLLRLGLDYWPKGARLCVALDGNDTIRYTTAGVGDSIFLQKAEGKWVQVTKPAASEKGPQRYGTFKDAFNHRMVFVYGTTGSPEENAWSRNKAGYDAETWYYRGNGAVDVIADKDLSSAAYAGRGVILYGNASTNSAWKILLSDCPIRIARNEITAGAYSWKGDSLAAYFVWPLKDSPVASVGVIAGTGMKGMHAANANQYFAGASGFPDFMIFDHSMLLNGSKGVKMAGFYNNQWQLVPEELIKGE